MKIAGIVKCSFVDYPGRIAAVVFTPGCNLRCFYCHNRELIDGGARCSTTQQKVVAWLKTRRSLLDAVVVSGGEPTLQPGLAGFMAEVRSLGYLVKLDTNGTLPHILEPLINADLLDYVAMDIKAPPEKYDAICGVPIDHTTIDESIALLMNGQIDYEFRTTVIPQLTSTDILAIGEIIYGAKSYVLQHCRESQSSGAWRVTQAALTRRAPIWIEDVRRGLCRLVKNCTLRGFERSALFSMTDALKSCPNSRRFKDSQEQVDPTMEDKKMAWKATVEEVVIAPQGEYEAKVINIENREGPHGPMVRIEFKLAIDDETDECTVSGLASDKLSESTKLGRWVAAILGHMPAIGEEITVDQLLHRMCRIKITHKTTADGKTFANVTEVLRSTIPF